MRRAFAKIIPCLPGLANRNKQLHSDVCGVPWGGHGYSQFPVFQWTFQSIAHHPKFSGLKGSLFYYFLWFCGWWEWFFYLWVNATWCLQSDGNPPGTASLGWSHPCLMIGFVSARVMGMTQPWVMFSELRQKWVSSPASLVSLEVHSDQGAPKAVREWIPVFKCFSASASITFAKVPLTTWARSNSRCKSKITPLDERSCKVISGRGASVRVGDICGHFSNVLRMSRWIPLSKEFFLPISSPTTGPCFSSSPCHHLKLLALPQICIWASCSIQVSNMWTLAQSRLCFARGLGFCEVLTVRDCGLLLQLPSAHLSIHASMHTHICLFFLSLFHPSINQCIHTSVFPSCFPSSPSFLLSFPPSIHPCIHASIHMSVLPSFLPFINPSIHLPYLPSIHLFIPPSVHHPSIHAFGTIDSSLRVV